MKKIALAGDHAGYEYKKLIISKLQTAGYVIHDFGTFSNESVDYPDYAHPLAAAVEKGDFDLGILICGSGNGVSITANKHQGIRAALCWTPEIASLARQHNDANVVSIPSRFVSEAEAWQIVNTFIATDFEGGRHANRVEKIACV